MLIPSSVLKKQKKRVKPAVDAEVSLPLSTQDYKPTLPRTPTQNDDALASKRSRFTQPEITTEHLQTIICGLELVFSDYAYHEESAKAWIDKHERRLEGNGGYFHLASLIDHPLLLHQKPPPTQPILKRALSEYPSPLFSLSHLDTSHMIQRLGLPPAIQPPQKTITGRTVYVEAHLSTLAGSPTKVAYHLKHRSSLLQKHLPIQHVWNDLDERGNLRRNYAWVILNAGVELQWREGVEVWKSYWPSNWIVLSKREHEQRTEEYQQLLDIEARPNGRQQKNTSEEQHHRALTRWSMLTSAVSGPSSAVQGNSHEANRHVQSGTGAGDGEHAIATCHTQSDSTKERNEQDEVTEHVAQANGKKRRRQLAKKKMKEKKRLRKAQTVDAAVKSNSADDISANEIP